MEQSGGRLKARRVGLTFQPPTLFLEYEDQHSVTRIRAVKLRIVEETDPEQLFKKVRKAMPRAMDSSRFEARLLELLHLVVRRVQASQSSVPEASSGKDRLWKEPGRQQAAGPPPAAQVKPHGARTSDSSELQDAVLELDDADGSMPGAGLPPGMSEEEDLNKVSEARLQVAKQQMDVLFRSHQMRPDDPNFVYDLQVDFGAATEANDWDEDECSRCSSGAEDINWQDIEQQTRSLRLAPADDSGFTIASGQDPGTPDAADMPCAATIPPENPHSQAGSSPPALSGSRPSGVPAAPQQLAGARSTAAAADAVPGPSGQDHDRCASDSSDREEVEIETEALQELSECSYGDDELLDLSNGDLGELDLPDETAF